MILSDQTIARHIEDGIIGVDPEINEEQIQPASLDICLGAEIGQQGAVWEDDYHTFEPGQRYLGHTMEKIRLPRFIAAMLAGRSTTARKGIIIHKTAGWVDPGYEGQLTLEIANFSEEPVTIETGDRIGQLVFFKLDHKSAGYDGQYQGKTGVQEAGEL